MDVLSALTPDQLRALLPSWVASHVAAADPAPLTAAIDTVLATASDAELLGLRDAFLQVGTDYRFYPAAPLGRRITRVFMSHLVQRPAIEGQAQLEHFLSQGPQRRLLICNHLSYTDTQVTDVVLSGAGLSAVADRLIAIAGPKVYTEAWRRMAALSLNTRKTVQSSAVATEQDNLPPRELARIAQQTIEECERLMDEGWIILLYPEGTRSRTGHLQPFLKAAGRYTTLSDLQVLPMVQTGSDRIFPVDDPLMHPAPVRIAFGTPLLAADYSGRTALLDTAHAQMRALLPPDYQP